MDVNIHGRYIDSLKHNLCHALTVSLWVLGCFGKKNGMSFRSNMEFIVKGMMPDLLHVIPVGGHSSSKDMKYHCVDLRRR